MHSPYLYDALAGNQHELSHMYGIYKPWSKLANMPLSVSTTIQRPLGLSTCGQVRQKVDIHTFQMVYQTSGYVQYAQLAQVAKLSHSYGIDQPLGEIC
jgi:hypothetical protein